MMTVNDDQQPEWTPTGVVLHRNSRLLSIAFADGKRFALPCEYLRVFSPAAEVRTAPQPLSGKEQVNIDRIEAVGHYAIRLHFDDGHDTGVYSWSTLYELGTHYESNWRGYLKRLGEAGIRRATPTASTSPRVVKVLYFSWLVNAFGQESETVTLPEEVADAQSLLAWLRERGDDFQRFLIADGVRVTVNRRFAQPFTPLEHGDEVGIVPAAPQPVNV